MISITETASEKVKELLANEGREGQALRIFVKGMSCSGPAYGMALDDSSRPGDAFEEQFGVKIVVDPQSAPYVEGAEIDYIERLMDRGFTITNPNTASAGGGGGCGGGCSCGAR